MVVVCMDLRKGWKGCKGDEVVVTVGVPMAAKNAMLAVYALGIANIQLHNLVEWQLKSCWIYPEFTVPFRVSAIELPRRF